MFTVVCHCTVEKIMFILFENFNEYYWIIVDKYCNKGSLRWPHTGHNHWNGGRAGVVIRNV